MKNSNILLFSGGIDSYIGYHYLKEEILGSYPQALYFDIKGLYSKKELRHISFIKTKLNMDIIINEDLTFLGTLETKKAYVPFRNLYFAMRAASYADNIWICGVKDDHVTDKTPEVFKLWSEHLSELENRNIQIRSPFFEKTKEEIVRWFSDVYYQKDKLIFETISCYSPDEVQYCGNCQACFRKACALKAIDLDLPFYNNDLLQYYKERAQARVYEKSRNLSIMRYLSNFPELQ